MKKTVFKFAEGVGHVENRGTKTKKHGGVVRFIKECFGANHTFSPMVGEGGTECRMRRKFFNVHSNSSPHKNIPLTRHCEGGNGLPTEAIRLILQILTQIAGLFRAPLLCISVNCRMNSPKPDGRTSLTSHNDSHGKSSPNPLPVKHLLPYSPINYSQKSTPLPNPLPQGAREGARKRVAFTLAEVLITLGIIGVVAALTLPSVIEKHKEQVTVNKVKKFYSVISQAMLLAINDNGFPNEWDVPVTDRSEGAQKFMEYIKPYLKISRDCGVEPGCLGYTENVNLLSGAKHNYNYDARKEYYKVILNDGSYMWIRINLNYNYCEATDVGLENSCGAIFTDINGGKAPNTVGKDIFVFHIVKNGQIKTASEDEYCLKSRYGWGCSGYILKNGNMNYLH